MTSVSEEKSVISRKAYNRGRKKNKKSLEINLKEGQGNICSSIQKNVTVSDIQSGIGSENLGHQLWYVLRIHESILTTTKLCR